MMGRAKHDSMRLVNMFCADFMESGRFVCGGMKTALAERRGIRLTILMRRGAILMFRLPRIWKVFTQFWTPCPNA